MYETVLVSTDGSVATVTMNRPEVRNAQNAQLIDELDDALGSADADDSVNVIVLAGAGKSFSTGHDLKYLVSDSPDEWARMRATPEGRLAHEQTMYFERCLAIQNLKKPTIAAVQGHCVAAGLMLACMCDLIVAADDAVFANPVLRMTGAGVELLVEPWELGIRKAKEFLFTGDDLDAATAAELGLVNRVVPAADLAGETGALAQRIAAMPSATVQLVKKSLNKTWELMGRRDALDYHFMVHQFAHDTATSQAALAERKQAKDMKEVFSKRDEGFEGGTA